MDIQPPPTFRRKLRSSYLKDAVLNKGDLETTLWPVYLHIIVFINVFPFSLCTEMLSLLEQGEKKIFPEGKKRYIKKKVGKKIDIKKKKNFSKILRHFEY